MNLFVIQLGCSWSEGVLFLHFYAFFTLCRSNLYPIFTGFRIRISYASRKEGGNPNGGGRRDDCIDGTDVCAVLGICEIL